MKTYLIQEEQNGTFAKVRARSGVSALRKAAADYPRRRCDYNLEPGETCEVTWRAVGDDDGDITTAAVQVPGRGPGRIRIGEVA